MKPRWRAPSAGALIAYPTLCVVGVALLVVGHRAVHGWGITMILLAVALFTLNVIHANRQRWLDPGPR